MSFAAIDVETANAKRGSICSIGVAVVRDGVRVGTREWLCRPPAPLDYFGQMQMYIHKITPGMVAAEPTFAQRWPEVLREVGDLPVVAHNAAFDMDNIRQACNISGMPVPEWKFGCTREWSKAHLADMPNHRLKTITRLLGITLQNHHQADADAAAAAELTVLLAGFAGARTLPELAETTGTGLCQMTASGIERRR
ncbi:DNA polymerase III subunit epsilon [Nocardia sp. CT2-14]|uniref:DNA polymerase III subunit epsilon n=1 Tax=Nocardia aurantiaca TaxID=2675850 RepID=A0A6I3KXD0_9NOCA|nr:DNA polymerase III subunit epsilon [Nocardia aurantiaca]